jgi:signal transduction histidine kinase
MVVDAILRWARSLRGSVRVRTTAAAVAVVGVTLLLGAIGLVGTLHTTLVREVRSTAEARAAVDVRLLESGGDPVAGVTDDDVAVQVLSASGDVLGATANAAGLPPLARILPGRSREVDVPFDDDPFLVVAAAATDGRTVLEARTLDVVVESTSTLIALLATGLPVLLLLVGATTWRVVGRALAPVEAMRAEVDAISSARLDRRVPRPAVRDEIGRLADTMNLMLDRLERAHGRQRRFVADASHELRSPIAAVRQQAEVALAHADRVSAGELAAAVHAESLRMQSLVDDLLLLARADEHALSLRRRPVDLDDVVFAEARRLREATSSGARAVSVDARAVSAARVRGDAMALARVLHNLGDNAARHARHAVAFALSEEDGWAALQVDDDGPGVPSADRSRVFERFVRLDASRAHTGGSGLGLSIVAELVTAHGGTVVIDNGPLGGARVTVRLPLSD